MADGRRDQPASQVRGLDDDGSVAASSAASDAIGVFCFYVALDGPLLIGEVSSSRHNLLRAYLILVGCGEMWKAQSQEHWKQR